MSGGHRSSAWGRGGLTARRLLGLLGLALLVVGCSGGGNSGSVAPPAESEAPSATSAALAQQATLNLVELYRDALLQEDIDRLQGLLAGDGGAVAAGTWLDAMGETFRTVAVTDLQLGETLSDINHAPFALGVRGAKGSHLDSLFRSVAKTFAIAGE